MSETPRAVLAALLTVQLLFASLHVFGKIVLLELSPFAFAGTRVLIATPILLLLAWRHDRIIPARADWPRLALLGLLGIFANQTLFLVGLSYTSATSSAILMPSIPVFTAAVAALLGVERLAGGRSMGILVASAGALVLLDPTRLDTSAHATIGNLLILTNCLAYSIFLVLMRPLLARIPWRTLIAWSFLFGSVGTLAVAAPSLLATDWLAISTRGLVTVAYIGVIPTALNFSLNTWAVRRSSPALVAAFTTLQPVLTSAMAAWALGEIIRPNQVLGFLLIVLGLVLVQRRPRTAAVPP